MRIAVNVVIEMTPEQVEEYAYEYGKDPDYIREDVRNLIESEIQNCAASEFWSAYVKR